MIASKFTTVGSSAGVVLPKEALVKLNVAKGDTLYLTDAPDDSLRITPQDPEFARRAGIIEDIMREERDSLAARSADYPGCNQKSKRQSVSATIEEINRPRGLPVARG
jgi:putative addiction module antidote